MVVGVYSNADVGFTLEQSATFEWSWWGQVPHMSVGPRGATVHARQWRAMTVSCCGGRYCVLHALVPPPQLQIHLFPQYSGKYGHL